MKLLILRRYNNYFNRVHRRHYVRMAAFLNHIEELNDNGAMIDYYNFEVQDFDYADGVTTEVVIGNEQQQQTGGPEPEPLDWKRVMPDYLIVHHYTQSRMILVNGDIDSRWFVIKCTKIRGGQYRLTLRRDVITDFLYGDTTGAQGNVNNEIAPSLPSFPALIKKGYVEEGNPLILNAENVTVNQIKKDEILLQDNSKTPWIVGYMSKDTGIDESVTVQIPPEDFSNYTTVEDLADELGISSSDLLQVLDPRDTSTPTYFLDTNTEIVGWVNNPNSNNTEWKMRTGSYNNLQAFNVSYTPTLLSHDPVSDCFAVIDRNYKPDAGPWTEAVNEGISGIRDNWEVYTGHPLLVRSVYEKLHSMSKTNNKNIILMNGTYYYICEKNTVTQGGNKYEVSKAGTVFESICSSFVTKQNAYNPYANVRNLTGGKIFIYCNEIQTVFYLERITDTSVIPGATLSMSSTRYGLVNEPYDMFALPLNSIKAIDNGLEYNLHGDYSQKLAVQMAKQLDKKIYDIQLLPYCPLQDNNTGTILQDNTLDLTTLREGYDYDWITEDNVSVVRKELASVVVGPTILPGIKTSTVTLNVPIANANITSITYEVAFGTIATGEPLTITHTGNASGGTTITTSSFTWLYSGKKTSIPVIQFTITFTQSDFPTNIIIYPKTNSNSFLIDKKLVLKDSMKIENICNNYRLVSPNYQGSFDFNVAKNGGKVDGFTVDFTYKPYTPYIRVAPLFGGLYGHDFGDCRGLICGGDFSIGIMNDAWESYQLQNKNYQNIFNREIQNLEVNQGIQRTQQYLSGGLGIAASALGGGISGGMAGGKAGGPWGAVIGAAAGTLVGGAASGIGYGVDVSLMNKQMIEQRQYAIDKYQLQLGNIQALPYTLTKIGAFNVNSKIYPFIEYYTCTDEEKEALRQKIHYEGMTLGIIGSIGDYIDYNNGSFIQADLIRTFDVSEWWEEHYIDPSEDISGYQEEGLYDTEAIANAIYEEFSKGIFWYSSDDADKFSKYIWNEGDEGE